MPSRDGMKFETFVTCPKCSGTGKLVKFDPAKLKEARVKAGLSLRGLAKIVGVSAAHLSDIERGNRGCTKAIATFYQKL